MRKSILAIALALFVSGLAGAASLGEVRIKAPGPFTVGGTAMPAGAYKIEQVSPAGVLQITNTETNASVLVIGSPVSNIPGSQIGSATFTQVAGKYALAQVYLPTGVSFAVGSHMETATLGGGCFWCLEAVYQELRGVQSVISGYMGGHTEQPSYREVCSGATGHAEVIQIVFDPSAIHYRDILEVFFDTHDPTTLNRQGHDVGTQYRSAIFYHSEEQKRAAESFIEELTASRTYSNPIVTAVTQAGRFWPAEDYHQNYLRDNPNQPYCAYVVQPKLAKFQKHFQALRKQS